MNHPAARLPLVKLSVPEDDVVPRDDGEEEPLAIGAVVSLASGGPLLTVTALSEDQHQVTVSWFVRRAPDVQTAVFPGAALVRADPGDD